MLRGVASALQRPDLGTATSGAAGGGSSGFASTAKAGAEPEATHILSLMPFMTAWAACMHWGGALK